MRISSKLERDPQHRESQGWAEAAEEMAKQHGSLANISCYGLQLQSLRYLEAQHEGLLTNVKSCLYCKKALKTYLPSLSGGHLEKEEMEGTMKHQYLHLSQRGIWYTQKTAFLLFSKFSLFPHPIPSTD